ncbi:hypothetical protein GCM10011320_57510 [Neoroseomonas lacus]|uniref:OmpR/PhoB-type domain-containing protein n=1 Tax=Neoroseomonas lacus TaxID=287609 RepID=A0A917P0M0_9PROT|nr:hypothetical protein GCM10011320_57510 [Neoroseomonas lacus]
MLCFAGFSLDLSQCVLRREDQQVPLRPKAFDALRYLAEHPHQLLTKEELLQALWPGVWVTDDSLSQCIRAVRLALDDTHHQLVQTVPRRGYVFAVDVIRSMLRHSEDVPVTASQQPQSAPILVRPIPRRHSGPPHHSILWLSAAALSFAFTVFVGAAYWRMNVRPAALALADASPEYVATRAAATDASPVERRVALVVGNGSYDAVDLPGARRDAAAVAQALRQIGFANVVLLQDPPHQVLLAALGEFALAAEDADWAVIYYAGRGAEVGGAQFLVPAGAVPASSYALSTEAIALTSLLRSAASARRLRLIVFDACRVAPGVADPRPIPSILWAHPTWTTELSPRGATLVAFSTAQGQQAVDGAGSYGPYAEALLAAMDTPGLELGAAFRGVRDRVLKVTDGRQEPFLYGSLPAEPLYFRPP